MEIRPRPIPSRLLAPVLVAGLLSAALASAVAAQETEDPRPSDLATGFDATAATARSAGRVVDRSGAPVHGVTVRLTARSGGAPQPPVTTDAKGRWSTPPLPSGRYDIVLEKEGFLPSDGFVDVSARPSDPIVVELRSLDEVTPAFAEGDPRGSIEDWIEKGNTLLEQGQAAGARDEYRKALRYLEGERRAEVLRAVARTHYLDGDVPATLDSLVDALRAWPASEETRVLYRTLMEQLGRVEQADGVLADLGEAPAEDDGRAADAEATTRRRPPPPEPIAAAAHRSGEQTVRFTERSPFGTRDRILGRYGIAESEVLEIDSDALAYDLADESFDLLVPDSYRAEPGWGLVVWISPGPRGGVGASEVRALLARERLLWVGANDAGNPRPKWDRIGLALDAAHNVERFYQIDPERIVVAGYSGGGRTSMAAAVFFPEVFRGVVCWFGVDYFEPVRVAYKPGHSWPAAFPAPPRKTLSQIESRLRIALVTGSRDFNRSETAGVFREMESDGFSRVTYLEIPGADHYHGLDAEWLARALAFTAPITSTGSPKRRE
ncbi:MAG TPA: carboxypeptidase regulatory-like domain-containing protein [Thermoanaerobaculia bacterium]|nr:carboxypeptidase regulatory-like domain-containing protein [Thermoanaerobaculia bacterium]